MKKSYCILFNIVYSILGWILCAVQVGASMIANYNQSLVLALFQLSVGVLTNLFSYVLIRRKDFGKGQNYKRLLLMDCAIIILPYFLIGFLWIMGGL